MTNTINNAIATAKDSFLCKVAFGVAVLGAVPFYLLSYACALIR